ncbi:hypothetical protein [Streptomyces sp. 3213.3]|uniref:hypothetical protein n=1 Tax=Streptomyces sp. 3213.3 TaxID=1855348 RepID=UPI0010422E34|nr:hypothetical protein [Streptomyces sp. 3213.3]
MTLATPALLASLFTGGAAIVVGIVTRWTQLGLARDRARWEARLEVARFDAARFEVAQSHLIRAADGVNRYLASLDSIDLSSFEEREPFVFPILDSLSRVRADLEALPDFEGWVQVQASLEMLEKVLTGPTDARHTFEVWDAALMSSAVSSMGKARSIIMRRVINDASGYKWLR